MKALITGASGFIGSNLAARLVAEGAEVACVVRASSNLSRLGAEGVEMVSADLNQPEDPALNRAVARAEVIFHLAGVTRALSRDGYFQGNLETTRHLTRAMAAHGRPGQRLVYLSSQAAAGPSHQAPGLGEDAPSRPVSDYGRSKLATEEHLLALPGLGATIIRPPAVYGPGDADFLSVFRWIKRGIIALNGLNPLPMSLVYVEDLVRAVTLAARSEAAKGRIYFVTDGVAHTFESMARAAAQAMGRHPLVVRIPLPLVHLVTAINGLAGRITGRAEYLNPDKWHEIKQPGWLCDGSRICAELGFAPRVNLARGMAATLAWYNQRGWL